MNTDFEKQPGQRRPILLVSGVVAVCLFVVALLERRRASTGSAPASRPSVDRVPAPAPIVSDDPEPTGAESWTPSSDVDTRVWEGIGLNPPVQRDDDADEARDEPALYDVEHDVEVEVEAAPSETDHWQPQPEVEAWRPAADSDPHVVGPVGETVEHAPAIEQPAPAGDRWFGSFAPASPSRSFDLPSASSDGAAPIESEPADATLHAAPAVDDEPVIELPPVAASPIEPDPKRLPPPRLRRFMGTGATVLVLGLVLGAGVLASGATADSSSDPATVPDAVGTSVLPDTTAADTTSTDTTSTDTTSTDTTSTDTTTTDTTTTDTTTTGTTTTDTTTTPTTPTDTTPTSTTPDPTVTTTTPVDPVPPTPPASDPAPALAPVPSATPSAPVVAPAPTPPASPSTPAKPKARAKKLKKVAPPAKAKTVASPRVGTPASSDPPAVTSASGSDAIGSILSTRTAIPAVDASLLPTPAQVSFYVKASKPLPKLPSMGRVDHTVAQRLVAAGRAGKVGWTLLAAVSRLESNLGAKPGPLAGRNLPTAPTGSGLTALARFLHDHGARGNPLAPTTARKALTLYYDGSTRKADRTIALAALYGALGPAGMQKGVRAVTAGLQKRVLADHRVHLTVAGRSDIRHGRVDPRVLVTLEYLANSFHKVGVSDLVSGGALFSRSGSVSAHLYGRAADVASLHGKAVKGHQGPGTMTEQAIRRLLLLPRSLRPRQVISLMDVDGPTGNHGSFALPDHYDRIQIDY